MGFSGGRQEGRQQSATQTLRVHLPGLDLTKPSFLGRRFGSVLSYLLLWRQGKGGGVGGKKGGTFIWKWRGGEGFRGGEAGWCTPGLGGCREEGGGANFFFFFRGRNVHQDSQLSVFFFFSRADRPDDPHFPFCPLHFCCFSCVWKSQKGTLLKGTGRIWNFGIGIENSSKIPVKF